MRRSMLLLFFLLSVFAYPQNLAPSGEKIRGAESLTRDISSPAGYSLKIYVTKPLGSRGKLPVLFEVAWLSCDSVAAPDGPGDGFTQLIWDLAGRSGMATFRVDKPGVGGSGGPKCEELDFETELRAYRAAFAAMKDIPFLDTSRIYVIGFSNGGGFAPLVAQDTPVKGYLLLGGWYKTWLEHMLEHERRRMKLTGLSEAEINARMRKYGTFYDLYLNGRQTPGAIVRARPEMKEIWYDEPERQYGRPAAFYQQLQALNLAEAWNRVEVPVLAMHGEYDWVMSADDHQLLVAALNAKHGGSADYMSWPKADHGFYVHSDVSKTMQNDAEQKYDPELTEFVLSWLARH